MSIKINIKEESKKIPLDDVPLGAFFIPVNDSTLYQRIRGGHSSELLYVRGGTNEFEWLNVKTGKAFHGISAQQARLVDVEIDVKVK